MSRPAQLALFLGTVVLVLFGTHFYTWVRLVRDPGLRAPLGVFFFTGNHEFYSGAAGWLPEVASLGIRVLENERVGLERAGAGLDLAGIHDLEG